jgi:hypothetical protein
MGGIAIILNPARSFVHEGSEKAAGAREESIGPCAESYFFISFGNNDPVTSESHSHLCLALAALHQIGTLRL